VALINAPKLLLHTRRQLIRCCNPSEIILSLKKAQGTLPCVACKQQSPQNVTPQSMQFHATGANLMHCCLLNAQTPNHGNLPDSMTKKGGYFNPQRAESQPPSRLTHLVRHITQANPPADSCQSLSAEMLKLQSGSLPKAGIQSWPVV
jgi:hypothetical protein